MKKIFLGLGALALVLVVVPMFAAFEAHVINVTATIENALSVPIREIKFGTVFPQEELDRAFDVSLSASFIAEERVDDINYMIRQKPKCWNEDEQSPVFGQVAEDEQGNFICKDDGFAILPLLCPYLSKHEITHDGIISENDGRGIAAFHGLPGPWNIGATWATQVNGQLAKSQQDFSDTWNIDLKAPCFGDHCDQDWEDFVHGINPDATNTDDYIQPIENESKLFGCDLWLEVFGISLPNGEIGCLEKVDLMLVLDRSGSIDSSELATLKTAAKAFVDALAPSTAGVHIGQASFSTSGTLDLHLTDNATTAKAAIDALLAGGFTNLAEGITLATGELANPGDGHDRTDADSPDYMVIITDGAPNRPTDTATAKAAATVAANAADAAGVEIYVVGVGTSGSTADYLKNNIATDVAHYFDSSDFGTLEAILEGIAECNG